MSETEKQTTVPAGAVTVVHERQETTGPSTRPACSGEQAGLGRDDSNEKDVSSAGNSIADAPHSPAPAGDQSHPAAFETGNLRLETASGAKPAVLCHHPMESGLYCQSPAVGGRDFCYSHLRLRGRRARMARAVAQRVPFKLVLPPLDSMEAVLAGLDDVGSALAAGLLPPRHADQLLYTLRQAAAALRWMARSQTTSKHSLTVGAPPLSSGFGERAGDGDQQKRLVEEYPGFEAEFGLPAGLDLRQPPHLLVPPAAPTWPSATDTAGSAQAVVYSDPPPRKPLWTKESIELEELDKRREYMTEKGFNEQSCKIHARIEKQVKTEVRKEQEAEWQAEADRRNALEEKKAQIFRDMDEGQRRAYHLGVLSGIETAKREAEGEARNRRPPTAAVDTSRIVGMGRVDSR